MFVLIGVVTPIVQIYFKVVLLLSSSTVRKLERVEWDWKRTKSESVEKHILEEQKETPLQR